VHTAQFDDAGTVTFNFDQQASSSSTPASTNGSQTSPASPSGSSSTAQSTVTSTKLALLARVAGLDRGALATYGDKQEIERLVEVKLQLSNLIPREMWQPYLQQSNATAGHAMMLQVEVVQNQLNMAAWQRHVVIKTHVMQSK
jgi:hypothetical protein